MVPRQNLPRRVRREGLEFDLNLREAGERRVYLGRSFPGVDELAIAAAPLGEGSVAVDVGANVGFYTLYLARAVGASGRVHAFEPNPKLCRRLRRHVELNGFTNVTVNCVALSGSHGRAELVVPPGDNSGAAGLASDGNGMDGSTRIEVPVTTLDDYATEQGVDRIDVVKIDVEGYEPFVLEGARGVIQTFKPRMLVEVNTLALARYGWEPDGLLNTIQSLGYELFKRSHVSSALRGVVLGGKYGGLFDVHCIPRARVAV